jgi:hypothetical protein
LGHGVVVVAAHDVVGVLSYPIDTGHWLQGVINQVAQAKTDIMRFVERSQSRPVAVDVSHHKNSHRQLLLLGQCRIRPCRL